jgi:hypothetical protein
MVGFANSHRPEQPDPRGAFDLHAPIDSSGTSHLSLLALERIRQEYPQGAPVRLEEACVLWKRFAAGEILTEEEHKNIQDFVRWVQVLFEHEFAPPACTSHWAHVLTGCPNLPIEPHYDLPGKNLATRRIEYEAELRRWDEYLRLSAIAAPLLRGMYSVEER